MNRAVLTIATGRRDYWKMAVELARSFELKNRDNDIGLVILTDMSESLPRCLSKTIVKTVANGELGKGFGSKLLLDRFAPARQTLFVDADCLCVAPLESAFARFSGRPVSVIGGEISSGEWFGDVASTCARAGVRALPKFNGGVYYLEPGAAATAVYDRARAIEPRYDELELVRLRGQPNDELVMAIAMAQSDCWGIPEDGTILGDLFSTPEVVKLDVLSGRCVLKNPDPPSTEHRDWFPLKEVRPAVVHFLGHHITGRVLPRRNPEATPGDRLLNNI